MATSGSTNLATNRNELITEAFERAQVYGPGENIEAEDITTASRSLNFLMKFLQTKGMKLWAEEEGTLFIVPDQTIHKLGNDQAHWAITSSITSTQLSADEAIGQVILSVDSSTGMTVGDYIGVMNDSDDLEWGLIAAIPDATSVTTDTALVVAASEDNWLYTFTTKADRPIKIVDVQRRDESTYNVDIPVNRLSQSEYDNLPSKSQVGTVVSYYYDPQLTAGDFYPWLTPEDSSWRLIVRYRRTLEDFDTATDEPDAPQEWYDLLAQGLAVKLCPKFDVGLARKKDLQVDYELMLKDLEGWDNEDASIYLQPNFRGQRG